MRKYVAKFGGSSLADAGQFKKVADIIKADPCRKYIVASAPGKRFGDDIKVTDMLYSCYDCVFLFGNGSALFKKRRGGSDARGSNSVCVGACRL